MMGVGECVSALELTEEQGNREQEIAENDLMKSLEALAQGVQYYQIKFLGKV